MVFVWYVSRHRGVFGTVGADIAPTELVYARIESWNQRLSIRLKPAFQNQKDNRLPFLRSVPHGPFCGRTKEVGPLKIRPSFFPKLDLWVELDEKQTFFSFFVKIMKSVVKFIAS